MLPSGLESESGSESESGNVNKPLQHNPLVTDEWTSVKISSGEVCVCVIKVYLHSCH